MVSLGHQYLCPPGCRPIHETDLDLRSISAIEQAIQSPLPLTNDKNIWFFWHSGYSSLPQYLVRNIHAYHRRLAPHGWVIRVVNADPSSPCYIGQYLDVKDPTLFPSAFRENNIQGKYALQHYSDLVRFPLLWKYGGVYADVGFLQIGDLNEMWDATIADENNPYQIISYCSPGKLELMNYFIAASKENECVKRCHELFLKLWEGRTSTEGLWNHPLLAGVPLLGEGLAFDDRETGRRIEGLEMQIMLTDYIIQAQVISAVLGCVDEEEKWNGPEYFAKRVYSIDFEIGSQLINTYTKWDGRVAWELLKLQLPSDGEIESDDHQRAREIVEGCLERSFGFKLAHGLILRVMGPTLGSLWRDFPGSDDVEGTYAAWLRYGMVHWKQCTLPLPINGEAIKPSKIGSLLRLG